MERKRWGHGYESGRGRLKIGKEEDGMRRMIAGKDDPE